MAKSSTSKSAQPQIKRSTKSTTIRIKRSTVSPETKPAPPQVASAGSAKRNTKLSACLTMLARPGGATIEDLQSATGWQSHSVRGFLAGAVKKKLGLTLVSSKVDGDVRRYRLDASRG